MKSKMKKVLSIFALAAVMCTAVVGCGGNDDKVESVAASDIDSASGEFTYWSCFTGDSATWDEERVANYMKEYPDIKVDLQFVPEAAGIKNGKLLSAIAGGTAPDLIISDDYSSSYSYAAQGSFEPMEQYLEAMGLTDDDFFPSFYDMMHQDGHTYLVPQDSNILFMFFRTSMVEAAGLDPENPPQTIEELDAWAEAMTTGDGQTFGFIPWLESGGDPFIWPFMWGNELYDAETNDLILTDDAMVNLFEWMQSYAEKYDPEKIDALTSNMGGMFTPDHPFFKGQVAMVLTGNWFTNAIRNYAPDIEDDYFIAPIPTPDAERYGSSPMNCNVFSIPKGKGANGTLCAHFIKYCLQPEVGEENFRPWRSIPVNDAAFDGVSWTQEGDPVYLQEREMANHEYSGIPGLVSVAAQLGNEIKDLRDKLIYDTTLDPKTELQALEDKYQAELDK
jgi:multiple sugar transport system substrate-binding protein